MQRRHNEDVAKSHRRSIEGISKSERRRNEGNYNRIYCFIIYKCHNIQTLYDTNKPKSVIRIFQSRMVTRFPNDRFGFILFLEQSFNGRMCHSFAYNIAFRVDEQRVGYGVNVVYLGSFAVPTLQVGHLWPR